MKLFLLLAVIFFAIAAVIAGFAQGNVVLGLVLGGIACWIAAGVEIPPTVSR